MTAADASTIIKPYGRIAEYFAAQPRVTAAGPPPAVERRDRNHIEDGAVQETELHQRVENGKFEPLAAPATSPSKQSAAVCAAAGPRDEITAESASSEATPTNRLASRSGENHPQMIGVGSSPPTRTGVGFAQPEHLGPPAKTRTAGTTIEPTMLMWRTGLERIPQIGARRVAGSKRGENGVRRLVDRDREQQDQKLAPRRQRYRSAPLPASNLGGLPVTNGPIGRPQAPRFPSTRRTPGREPGAATVR